MQHEAHLKLSLALRQSKLEVLVSHACLMIAILTFDYSIRRLCLFMTDLHVNENFLWVKKDELMAVNATEDKRPPS